VWQDRQVSLGGVAGGSGYSTVSIARLARIADLELAPVSATTLTPGQTTVVQLTVRNRGPEAGPNSDIAISMPADGSLRFESLSVPVSSPGNVPLWTVSQVPAVGGFGSIQLLSNASIAPGAEQVINLTVRANPLQATSTVATLSFGNTGALPDPVLTNNQNVLRPIAINVPAACYANCDASTISPVLNAGDFTCFLSRFRAAQSLPAAQQASDYSNCDESTTPPVLNAGDFTCFLSRFRAGCP
jgi:hypothetical protein